jgi:hypothetical protein
MNDPEISRMTLVEPPLFHNPPCPWLPEVDVIHDFTVTRRHGKTRGAEFYQDALRYAQSQWLAGKPAQAILQLDKAWMADLTAAPDFPDTRSSPYHALAWILRHSADGNRGFPGNPVRHFQHLASRMSGPRAELRAWRAWLCMHLAERVLPHAGFPRDGRQIAREGLWIPSLGRALEAVATLGWPGEWLAARDAMVETACDIRENPQLPQPCGVQHA